MARGSEAKNYFDGNDDGDYRSSSSIDNPPREPKKGKKDKQIEMFDSDEHEDDVSQLLSNTIPDRFNVELKLTLKGCSGISKAHTIPIVAGEAPSERIEEVLRKNLTSEYFLNKLRAVVGKPREQEETAH